MRNTADKIRNNKMQPELLNREDFYSQKENISISVLLNKYFFKKEWKNLQIKLIDFKRNNNQKSLLRKASFYLGQCYYFQGEKQKAFLEFLTASDSFYPESRKWMDNILLSES